MNDIVHPVLIFIAIVAIYLALMTFISRGQSWEVRWVYYTAPLASGFLIVMMIGGFD